MAHRVVKQLLPAPSAHWVGDGFNVHAVFGRLAFTEALSPFLMFDYGPPKYFEPTSKRLGVGKHPHRGFETVTIAWQGAVEHADSAGNHGIVDEGDVQWMTAGRGIVHSEYHSEEFARKGGNFEFAQLWVNLPAAYKMTAPRYQPIKGSDIPEVPVGGGSLRVIAGSYSGAEGAAKTWSPVNLWDLTIREATVLDVPEGHTLLLFVRDGSMTVGVNSKGTELGPQDLALFEAQGTKLSIQPKGEAKALVLTGEPIREPIVSHGPFCMNTREEIQEAFRDYQSGNFGK